MQVGICKQRGPLISPHRYMIIVSFTIVWFNSDNGSELRVKLQNCEEAWFFYTPKLILSRCPL